MNRLIPLAATLLLLLAGCSSHPKTESTTSPTIQIRPTPTATPTATAAPSPATSASSATTEPSPTTTPTTAKPAPTPSPAPPPVGSVAVVRSWTAPIELETRQGGGWDPTISIRNGTVYVATGGAIYQQPSGSIFEDITPAELMGATPTAFSAHDALWVLAPSTVPGATAACRNITTEWNWTCNDKALPTEVDRFWIQGTGVNTSILQATTGFQSTWYTTQDGRNYTPLSTVPVLLGGGYGNLALDAHGAVWQLMTSGVKPIGGSIDTLQLLRIEKGLVTVTDTKLPLPYGLPWLASDGATLWTTNEARSDDGTRTVAAARSRDGTTWQTLPLPHTANNTVLGSVAARGNRAAVAYYGTPQTGDPATLEGTWNYYVAETSNAQDLHPTWTERLVASDLHQGALCIGSCTLEGSILGGDDPDGAFAGSVQGIAIDEAGNVHACFARDLGRSQFSLFYTREVAP